jgi:hypothetical protein
MGYKRISPQPVVEGGTGIQSATAYAPLCGNGTSGFLSASTGQSNSSYVLTSTGSSSLPTWQVASGGSGGALILLDTQTVTTSAASIVFNDAYITSSYAVYFVLFNNVGNDTASVTFNMDWSINNGSTYLNSGYYSGINYFPYNSAGFTNVNSTSTNVLTSSVPQYTDIYGFLYLNLPQGTNYPTSNGSMLIIPSLVSGDPVLYNIVGSSQSSTVTVNAIKFSFSSGNIAPLGGSSTISLYGLQQ